MSFVTKHTTRITITPSPNLEINREYCRPGITPGFIDLNTYSKIEDYLYSKDIFKNYQKHFLLKKEDNIPKCTKRIDENDEELLKEIIK